jgi:uncharacterized protein YbjT (DUF2867 family)
VKVLLTGATGYVGGRLLGALEREGAQVRCLARRPEFLAHKIAAATEVVGGDVLDAASLESALDGIDVAYFLVHSMGSTGEFEIQNRIAATNFAMACKAGGVKGIVYLGGLGREPDLSRHLRSRHEVGAILRESGIPTIELRASLVIGSGSLSFEMVRALVERLPVMITPRWVRHLSQPIAIEDLIHYLLAARSISIEKSEVVEIGGSDQISYGGIMHAYARHRGLKRLMIPVPILSPRLSSRWLGLVTPLYARIGRKLLDSVRNHTVVESTRAAELFPDITPRGIEAAVARALALEDRDLAETRWSDAISAQGAVRSWAGIRFRSRIVDSRSVVVDRPPAAAFAPIRRIGGDVGWYGATWLWRIRGFLDLLVGGVGVRRGRHDPEWIAPGDVVDFWRVESFEPNRRVRLVAEMKLPGRAWLEFEAEPEGSHTRIRQTAIFDPVGLAGLAYWYALYPLHGIVFGGMLRGIARAATLESSSVHSTPTASSPSLPLAPATPKRRMPAPKSLDHRIQI